MIDLQAELAKVKAEKAERHEAYAGAVRRVLKQPWNPTQKYRPDYGRAVYREATFGAPEVQESLWNGADEAIVIGVGRRVVVGAGAFVDEPIVRQFEALRADEPSPSNEDLDEALTDLLERMMSEGHVSMRPRARLMRIFALIRPWDVAPIVWEPRLDNAFAQLGLPKPSAGVMQKHRLLLDALWDRLGKPDTLEEQLWYNLLAHHLGTLPLPVTAPDPSAPESSTPNPIDAPVAATPAPTHTDPAYWLARYAPADLVDLPLDALTAAFATDDFIFPDDMLRHMHAALTALPDKRFAVIGGLSGTGKSTFARLYAKAICAIADVDEAANHIRFVAVRPDWTDPAGLLGHPNLLFEPPRWHHTAALSLILAAVGDPTRPYVLILEEMNLARVEHYLAPLLTAMENPAAGLRLHGLGHMIGDVPPLIPWPRNLFIIGTVNMDATTQAFSDKVLDRAFIWEMATADVGAWVERQRSAGESDDILDPVADVLVRLYPPLEAAGRHFGYRVCDEILAFCRSAGDADAATLDVAVFSKVLPRLRGDDHGGLSAALSAAYAICSERGFARSAERVRRMQADLNNHHVARFWS